MTFNRIGTLLILFGIFYYSEGKVCPEKTRSHQTRCEMYFKCVELPTHNHVWVPVKCEKGLVYVHNLKMCALPGDDWECTLGDNRIQQLKTEKPLKTLQGNKESEIYILTNRDDESNRIEQLDDGKVEIVLKSDIRGNIGNEEDIDEYESSGDSIDFSEGFIEATNKENSDPMKENHEVSLSTKNVETTSQQTLISTTNVDPSLTAHLQRLSQLIDGLKKKYQDREHDETNLSPDQLNAFLAHFNIKNEFNTLGLTPSHSNGYESISLTSTISPLLANNSNEREPTILAGNRTKLKPETKVVLASSLPQRYGSTGYSNSQIVVNRPEGSVLFSLTPYENNGHYVEHTSDYDRNSPKISEDTLKTVLELSKQMIANQNVPKIIPNPSYYPQAIIQPLILPPSPYAQSSTSTHNNNNNNPFSNYFNVASNYHNNYGNDYDRPENSNIKGQNYGYKKPSRPSNSDDGYKNKPSTTIIHNNVIPVHVTSTGTSGEKEVIDSYGHNLEYYPPLPPGSNGNSNNGYAFQLAQKYENNQLVTTARPYASADFPSPYDNSPSTTIRPPLEFHATPETIAHYYTPNPHLSENNVNSLFSPPNRYTSFNRFYENGGNIHGYQQVERPSSYQAANKYSTFPMQQNSEKLESMESEDQQESFSNYEGNSLQFNTNQFSPNEYPSQIPTYSTVGNKNPYMSRPQQSNNGNVLNKPKLPNFGDTSQLVNIGGNFISLDTFQNTIFPLMGESTNNLGNIEVISCQAGVRQPNITDCRRYYVCSKKDGKVLSYSCPPYTAFNEHTRICDARTYANCAPNSMMPNTYTVSENKRLEQEAQRRRADAIKAQQLAGLIQQYNAQLNVKPQYNIAPNFETEMDNTNVLSTYVQQAAAMVTPAPTVQSNTTTSPKKKRKYYCKEGDKVPDQTSIYNYFICYKNSQGMMKGHKMTCSKGLLFCPMTRMCTLSTKCS